MNHSSLILNLFLRKIYLLINNIFLMEKRTKWAYVGFMGLLTCSAVSACYWQGSKYFISTERWKTIKQQLNRQQPDDLGSCSQSELYPLKYIRASATLSPDYQRVERTKGERMGYLVLRGLKYKNKQGDSSQIVALEGWCEDQFDFKPKKGVEQPIQVKGILRQKEKKDFVHQNFKKQELERYNTNTFINNQEIIKKFNIVPNNINQKYYLQILKPLNSDEYDEFPYQYSVDNFQLPYLTPDKHLTYATFWGFCSILGISTIIRVLRFK